MKLTQVFYFYSNFFVMLVVFFGVYHNVFADDNQKNKKPKAIVVGATSGMGRVLSKLLAQDGYEVGIVGRRENLLKSLQEEIKPARSYIKPIDVSRTKEAAKQISELISEMGGLDIMIISVGAFMQNMITNTERRKRLKGFLDVDVAGFWVVADVAVEYFKKQKAGHLVGFSSIDGLRGVAGCPVYSGAKAFVSRYLEGVRNFMIQNKLPVTVTDIIPGWVDNETMKFSEQPGTYWVASTRDAADQIYNAIKAKKKKAYITKRWQVIAWLLNIVPDWLYNAVGGF